MEKLWSPWRSKYIESFSDKEQKNNCIFCDAVKSNPEADDSLVLHKDKNCFVVMNLYPYNNGHLMI
ncbi:MAG: HIT family hydrolase, partial [Ignavibacteriales bacterium]|nr:HIT family hydrolase [Ignavibacteriales bacterium]